MIIKKNLTTAGFIGTFLLSSCLWGAAEQKIPMPTLEEKNKEADRAFIRWKLDAPRSTLTPALRGLLTPQAIAYLVEESQIHFHAVLSKKRLKSKVDSLTEQFIKNFNPTNKKVDLRELRTLVRKLIAPEYLFIADEKVTNKLDRTYNDLLRILKEQKTLVKTTLREWALRFLTSESITVALPIIERLERGGKVFNKMTPNEKRRALRPVVDVVVRRFMHNLRPVQEKFRFDLPLGTDAAVRHKVRKFLDEKFVAR